MTKLIFNKKLQLLLQNFLKQYDETKLEETLQLYTNMQQEYLCKTIRKDTIILVNNTNLHMSRNCAPKS